MVFKAFVLTFINRIAYFLIKTAMNLRVKRGIVIFAAFGNFFLTRHWAFAC